MWSVLRIVWDHSAMVLCSLSVQALKPCCLWMYGPNSLPQLLTVFKSVRIAPQESLCQSRRNSTANVLCFDVSSSIILDLCSGGYSFAGVRALSFKQGGKKVKFEFKMFTWGCRGAFNKCADMNCLASLCATGIKPHNLSSRSFAFSFSGTLN